MRICVNACTWLYHVHFHGNVKAHSGASAIDVPTDSPASLSELTPLHSKMSPMDWQTPVKTQTCFKLCLWAVTKGVLSELSFISRHCDIGFDIVLKLIIIIIIIASMHSNMMRTARLLPVSPSMYCGAGSVCSWGVSAPGPRGYLLLGRGCLLLILEGLPLVLGGISACNGAEPPHPREQNSWHTLLKILHCPNFVAGCNNNNLFFLLSHLLQNAQ